MAALREVVSSGSTDINVAKREEEEDNGENNEKDTEEDNEEDIRTEDRRALKGRTRGTRIEDMSEEEDMTEEEADEQEDDVVLRGRMA